MNCPKCNTVISDNQTVCPKCHKVFLLECPNCHSIGDSAICSECGYHILVKCSKCGRLNPVKDESCPKCGFSVSTSLAYQECESDEIASVIIQFNNLKKIRRLLKSKDLYKKFYFKLKNLLLAQIKNAEGLFISYGDTYVMNFNKELSFPTSSNKAVRFALKLANSMTNLNKNIQEELKIPLGLNITIIKKSSEKIQELEIYGNEVKLLTVKKGSKKYLKGTQIIMDQFVWDEVNKDYTTDSLYSVEKNGQTVTFYEIVLDSYILPPDNEDKDEVPVSSVIQKIKRNDESEEGAENDLNSFNVFDINAKCSFETVNAISLKTRLKSIDFNKNGKLVALRSKPEFRADVKDIAEVYEKKGYRVITVICTDELTYKPWGFFEKLFRTYFGLPSFGLKVCENINQQIQDAFKPLFDLCEGRAVNSSTEEDARYTYIELWGKFLSLLNKTAVFVEGFEKLDDTSIHTLEFYFDKFKNIKPNFVFITSDDISVHSKIKGLLRTNVYTEFKLGKLPLSSCLETLKSDASDFIGSFYFEKIQENFKGSYLYFKYTMKYLIERGVLVDLEGKLLVKSSKSVVVPKNLAELYKARMKYYGRNQDVSFIMAYLTMIYPSLNTDIFKSLGIVDVEKNIKILEDSGILRIEGKYAILCNFTIFVDAIYSSLRKEAQTLLAKNAVAAIGSKSDFIISAIMAGKTDAYEKQYKQLCAGADYALSTGDYDAYLKNCLGFLSLLENVESIIPVEDIEQRKDEVYNSILKYLYSYAPTKIYFIENILLTDAIQENDEDKIVKLSNLMLQGALISSNYTDALGLLNNILSRMKNPTLIVDGAVNTRFLLLSLVNVEILYNLGKFRDCVDTASEILSVLRIGIIDKIKPASFSINSFVSHILETMRLAAFAKLYLMDDDLDSFLEHINIALDTELPEKDCILALRDYLAGRVYNTGKIEEYSAFSKVIFLILQELSDLQVKVDYKKFAQHVFQAKLLAEDIHQAEIKYFCDLLIAYAYAQIGIKQKANAIYYDVKNQAEKCALFNILLLSEYFIAKLEDDVEKALLIVNDALNTIQKHDNQAVILYVLFEKLYIELAAKYESSAVDIEAEEQKLNRYKESLKQITG